MTVEVECGPGAAVVGGGGTDTDGVHDEDTALGSRSQRRYANKPTCTDRLLTMTNVDCEHLGRPELSRSLGSGAAAMWKSYADRQRGHHRECFFCVPFNRLVPSLPQRLLICTHFATATACERDFAPGGVADQNRSLMRSSLLDFLSSTAPQARATGSLPSAKRKRKRSEERKSAVPISSRGARNRTWDPASVPARKQNLNAGLPRNFPGSGQALLLASTL